MKRVLALLMLFLPLPALAADAAAEQSLKRFFERGIHWQGATAELIAVERWPDVRGPLTWQLPRLHGHPKRLSLIARKGQGANVRRWYVPVRVHWWSKVVVATSTLPARSLLSIGMMTLKRVDIAGHHGKTFRSAQSLAGMRLIRPIHAGEAILSTQVRRPPMIRRGDPVQIVLDAGPIHVRTAGKALRTAARGDALLVQNLRSGQVLRAVAESPQLVRVSMAGGEG